jgi:hypothetical protein
MRLLRWRPECDGAVLVGYPFSPIAYAAPRLAARNVPYLVDIGDPWALTGAQSGNSALRTRRSRRAETQVWRAARGAIVTTSGQAEALRSLFPHLRILVRPNGFEPVPTSAPFARQSSSPEDSTVLRLAHYGNLSAPRIDIMAFLASLAASGLWRRIVLRQHGQDWDRVLDRAAQHVTVELRPKIEWASVLSEAAEFNAALVVGNRSRLQLPSKAIQYLTLPIPRVALVDDMRDSLAQYVADKPGWLTIRSGDPDAAQYLASLRDQSWAPAGLAPPAEESWDAVEEVLGRFVAETLVPVRPGAACRAPLREGRTRDFGDV